MDSGFRRNDEWEAGMTGLAGATKGIGTKGEAGMTNGRREWRIGWGTPPSQPSPTTGEGIKRGVVDFEFR